MLFSRKRVVSVSASSSSIKSSLSVPASANSIKSAPLKTVSPPKTMPTRRIRSKVSACLRKVLRRPEPSASTPYEFECLDVTIDSWCLLCPAYINAPEDNESTESSPAHCPTRNVRSRAQVDDCCVPISRSFLEDCTEAVELLLVENESETTSRNAALSSLFASSNTRSEYGLLKESGLLSSDDSSDDSREYDSVIINRRILMTTSYPSSSDSSSCRRINPMNSSYYPCSTDSSSSVTPLSGPSPHAASVSQDELDYTRFVEAQEELFGRLCAALRLSSFPIGKCKGLVETRFSPDSSGILPNSSSHHVAPQLAPTRASTFLNSCLRRLQPSVTRVS